MVANRARTRWATRRGNPTVLLVVLLGLSLGLTGLGAGLSSAAAADYAPGTLSTSKTSVTVAGSSNYVLKYSAGSTSRVRGTLRISIPGTWTAPQSSSSQRAGYTTVSRGTCAAARLARIERLTNNERRLVITVDCRRSKAFTITYRNAKAPTRAGTYTWPSTAKFNQWGTYVPVRTAPRVTVKPGPASRLVRPFVNATDSKTPLTAQIFVADQYGNTPPATPVAVTATHTGCARASLTGTPTATSGTDGAANFTSLTLNRACVSARLVFSAPGLQSATSAEFRVPGSWDEVAQNGAALDRATAVLPDGRVLFIGKQTRIFDPATATFSGGATSPDPRTNARAVTMKNGKVMVVGGQVDGNNQAPVQVNVYDPASDAWTQIADRPNEPVTDTFNDHLVLLNDGRVLDVPQSHDRNVVPMLYDPGTDSWATVPLVKQSNRQGQTVLGLADGRVLLTGGDTRDALLIDETEIFDPANNTWEQAPASPVGTSWAAGVALADGRAMLVGTLATGGREASRTVQTYDPSMNAWSQGPQLDKTRYSQSAVQRADGAVMAAGGTTYGNYPNGELTTVSLSSPSASTVWQTEGRLGSATDYRPLMVARPDNTVLLFDFASGRTQRFS